MHRRKESLYFCSYLIILQLLYLYQFPNNRICPFVLREYFLNHWLIPFMVMMSPVVPTTNNLQLCINFICAIQVSFLVSCSLSPTAVCFPIIGSLSLYLFLFSVPSFLTQFQNPQKQTTLTLIHHYIAAIPSCILLRSIPTLKEINFL